MTGKEVRKWADEAMFEAAPMQVQRTEDGGIIPQVHLVSMTADPLGAIAALCRMYKGIPTYSLDDITDDERRDYLVQVQKTHLQAPLEAVKLHFFIEGVTRSFTHQMVRQRTAVYAQESMRFAVKEEPLTDICSLPPSLAGTVRRERVNDVYPNTEDQRQRNRDVWERALETIDESYRYLVANGMPAEDARGVMPHAVTTRINYVTDLRNLIGHAGNRLCTQAQFEWRLVFMGIVNAIRDYGKGDDCQGEGTFCYTHGKDHCPGFPQWQFQAIADSDMFRPVCYQLGRCQFNADFDRYCNIKSRVEAFADEGVPSTEWGVGIGKPNFHESGVQTIRPEEWLLDPAAARNTSGGADH